VNKGHPALDMVARDITREEMGSTWLKNIIQTMREELGSQEDGVAIAAPQIGESIRMFVISPTAFHKNTKHFQTVNINPKILKVSKEKDLMLEGCLSVRWLYGDVERAKQVMIESFDENGHKHVRGASGLLAQIFQHEIDHLDGILFDSKAHNIQDLPPENFKKSEESKSKYNNLTGKRIAFFGTPDFTVDFLELFKKIGLDVALVVTGEDKQTGRGMQLSSPAPKLWSASTLEDPKCLQPQKLDEEFWHYLKNEHEKENFDLFIVIAYGKILPEKIINLPKYGTINLHYSLLPKYRGASPVETAILNADKETGITIQQMVYKLDAGNILFQEKVSITEDETANELRTKLNQRALQVFPEFLENFFSVHESFLDKKRGVTQDEAEASRCGKFSKEDLDVTSDIQNNRMELVYKKYKAFNRKVYFFFGEKKLRVRITEMKLSQNSLPVPMIVKVLPESRKEISFKDFENSFGKVK
jgi:methionyl-tRNA formyltransferase